MREPGNSPPITRNRANGDAQTLVERARRVLQLEQRKGHADTAIMGGGLATFIANWTSEMRTARAQGVLPASATSASGHPPEEAIAHLLTGYAAFDPVQRAAKVRAALALLDALDGAHQNAPHAPSAPDATAATRPTPRPVASAPLAPRPTPSRPQPRVDQRAHGHTSDDDWPLARPLPSPPVLSTQRNTARRSLPATPPRPEDEYLLAAPVSAIPGVGSTQEERLARLGISTVRDLLFTFPREHLDYSHLAKIHDLPFDQIGTILGMIREVENKTTGNRRLTRTLARVYDETGGILATWFNQPYLLKQLPRGAYVVLTGVKQRRGNFVEFAVKSHELPEQGDLINTGRLVPVYPLTEGLSPKAMRRFTKWAVDHCAGFVPDHIPAEVRARADLMALPEALAQIHYPDSQRELDAARHRLAFDELFLVQLGMLTRRANWQDGPPAPTLPAPLSLFFTGVDASDAHAEEGAPPAIGTAFGEGLWPLTAACLEETLPFSFTGAQRRSIREILADLARPVPMSRLLQGDVGSGKTVVAAAALLAAAANGHQGALLAPTEILAEQHFRGVSALLAPFGLQVVLLTGSQRAKERASARDLLASGTAAVAVGTHALIQEDVAFKRLALTIVDEQHRFGVEQRAALRAKGTNPHMLVMTATPIPRTLSLTLYGDLDISVLDELPAGRRPIETCWRAGAARHEAYARVEAEVAAGRQAYIICPLVEESEALEAKSAVKEYERLKAEVFPGLRLGLVHGQLKSSEKDRVMRSFHDGELDVLVATAVVEVGVDVPNATVMLIEDADRFGLSQLHQFRGRVGRGEHQSYCYLLSADASAGARERLATLEQTSDGFALAEADLRLRGPGDFFGTRQSGLPELKMANIADTKLIAEARQQAEWLWARDPYLRGLDHMALRERVFLFWRNFAAH